MGAGAGFARWLRGEGLRAYRNANLGLAQAAESRAKQEHDSWQVSERANQKLLEDSLPLIDSAFQARLRGEADPAGYVDLMKNKEFQKGGALYRFNFNDTVIISTFRTSANRAVNFWPDEGYRLWEIELGK